jgi:hypothetical protein
VFFDEQTSDSLIQAILNEKDRQWDAGKIRRNAEKFGAERYVREMNEYIQGVLGERVA